MPSRTSLPRAALPYAAALVVAALGASTTACATLGRERCEDPQTALGATPAHEDTKVVQRLLIALSTRDFDAFSAMQPSQSQYLAVAWKHGAERADAIAAAVPRPRAPPPALAARGAPVDTARRAPPLAGRCTRKMAVSGEEKHPLYALSVDFGPLAMAIPVYQSTDRTSLAGSPVVEAPVVIDTMARAVQLQVGLLTSLERARLETEALVLLDDYLNDHDAELTLIRERVQETSWSAIEESALSRLLAPFHADYGRRWQALQTRFPALFETDRFQTFLRLFYPEPRATPEPPVVLPPSDPDNTYP